MWHGNFQVQIYLSICFYWNLLLTCLCFILFLVVFYFVVVATADFGDNLGVHGGVACTHMQMCISVCT